MIRVSNLKVDVISDDIVKYLCKKLKIIESDIINYNIHKRSIDARKEVTYVYEIDVELKNENKIKLNNDIKKVTYEKYNFVSNELNKHKKIIVVGSGPAGLFCSYFLALNGYSPLVIERGEDMDNRIKSVEKFWNENILNVNSNVQFGEGGAGTFSDGKLTTQIKDKSGRIDEILKIFVENGAPKEILYEHMPHIGTDKLRDVVKNMRNKIISMGGIFRYNTCLTDIIIDDDKVNSIIVNNNEKIECDNLVLAIGHSARDTFRMLHGKNINMVNKPFAVGFRVMHPQNIIDENQYGEYVKYLNHASYKLTYNENGRGVYSFCMCPGGYVVNASSFNNKLVINGMSNYDRESGIANSAILVTVSEKDYGDNLFDGMKFQENLEESAYKLCNGKIPIQRLEDYILNKKTLSLTKFKPMIKGSYDFSNLNDLFSNELNKVIKNSFSEFGKKIKGFDDKDTLLAGIESRSSSPIRILRDDKYESNIKGIYPCGEGAGYAGGIMSSAVDGIKVFESIASKYKA